MDFYKLTLVFILACSGIVSYLSIAEIDYQDRQVENNFYCKMVQIWESNNRLPLVDRPGWPPYKGKEVCNGS